MDTSEVLKNLGFFTLGTISFSAVIGFIAKSLFNTYLNKKTELYKTQLLHESEKFKSELEKQNSEHEIKFSKLQDERAEVIKCTFKKLIDLQQRLANLTTMFQGPNRHKDLERDTAAKKSLDEFKEYVLYNRIYLPKGTCDEIGLIINQSWDIIVEMSLNKDEASAYELPPYNTYPGNTFNRGHLLKNWRELNRKVTQEIDKACLDLEENFRKLLGDR